MLRISLAVLGSLLVLLIAAAAYLVNTFDPNDYKDEITAFVQERTGRTLAIDEDIALSLFPWFAVETGGVRLSDDPAFGERDFVTVDALSARVRVWPLLRRRVEIGRVVLDGVGLNLGLDAEGRGNWASLTESTASAAPDAPAAAPERPAIAELAVEGIELRNARIHWHDADGEITHMIRDFRLDTGPIRGEAPVELSLELGLLDVATQTGARLELESIAAIVPDPSLREVTATLSVSDANGQERARASLELDALELDTASEALRVDGLTTRIDGIEAAWELSGTGMFSTPRLSGRVDLQGGSIAALLDTLGIALPAGVEPAELGEFAGSADFELGLAPLDFAAERLALSALGIEASGNASLAADGSIAASIELPAFRPDASLLELLGPSLPADVDPAAISSASASAMLTLPPDRDRIELDELALTLDALRIGGELTIVGLGPPTAIRGTLTATGLDDRLLAALLGAWLPEGLLEADLGEFRLATTFEHAQAAGITVFDPLELSAYGLSGDGQLTLDSAGTALGLSGQAQLAEFSPRALLERFELPMPESADPGVLDSARLAASFETTGDSGHFRDIVVELDDSSVTGELSVEDFADPSYRFVLRADQIDVDRYLPPRDADAPDAAAGNDGAAAGGDDTERRLGDIRLANEALSATPITGTASVGDLRIGGMRFSQLETALTIGNGRAALRPVRTRLYDGSFDGGLTVDATRDTPTVQLEGNAAGLALAPLLEDMLGEANLSGTGDFALDLGGAGDTIGEAVQTAAGSLDVAFRDGALTGLNAGRGLCAAVNAARQLPAPAEAPDATGFTLIRASATVSDGIASSQDLFATTGYLELTGQGQMRLIDQQLDTDFVARMTGPVPIDGCERLNSRVDGSIPIGFSLSGQLPEVEFGFDINQLIEDWVRREIRNQAQDAVRDRLEDALRGAFD